MKARISATKESAAIIAAWFFLLQFSGPPSARAYVLNYTVADMRLPNAQSGGSACPRPNHFNSAVSGIVDRRWSISLGANPVTILTQDQSPDGRLNEIENLIQQSFASWTSVNGTTLTSTALSPLTRTSMQAACSSTDGLNTICLNQNDALFTAGVLAFTRVVAADRIGETLPGRPPSAFIGEILDADILLRPNDANTTFATPQALPSQPKAYDLESVLTHELGHFFGFGHSGVWRAVMYPFAPPQGQFLGDRPTAQKPDAPLADDDRAGLRMLYPDPSDALNVGSIRGRVLPANPLSLPTQPGGVTGLFGTHVVAVDNATGAVMAATMGGWSCTAAGPPQFDGSYSLDRLPVGANRGYVIYVEPLDGPVDPGEVASTVAALCHNVFTDPGWPAQFSCKVPEVATNFTTRTRPGP